MRRCQAAPSARAMDGSGKGGWGSWRRAGRADGSAAAAAADPRRSGERAWAIREGIDGDRLGDELRTRGSVPPTRTRSDLGMGVMGISLPASVAIIGRRMMVRQKERSAFSILAAAGHLRECSFECTSSEATPTPG